MNYINPRTICKVETSKPVHYFEGVQPLKWATSERGKAIESLNVFIHRDDNGTLLLVTMHPNGDVVAVPLSRGVDPSDNNSAYIPAKIV